MLFRSQTNGRKAPAVSANRDPKALITTMLDVSPVSYTHLLNDQTKKDDVVTFEELGVDRLFVDESHYYKNLYLYTKMRNVGGCLLYTSRCV